jgi:nucleotide-binding universal stress UspA family protein
MTPFQTILFAADFSESSQQAFRAACSLAVEGRTRMHIAHVIEPTWVPEDPTFLGQAGVQYYGAYADSSREERVKRLLCSAYAPDIPVEVAYHVKEGAPATHIVQMAAAVKADLIVVGTHGRTGLRWMLAGSVANSVMQSADCPVLAVHSFGHPPIAETIQSILQPTDFSDRSEAALHVARELARDLGARLILLRVAPFDVYVHDITVPIDLETPRAALEDLCRRVDGPDLKYPVDSRLSQGDPAEEILRRAAELGPGLIVMGTHGRTALGRLLFGSVTEYVLPRARCPVLAVKARTSTTAATAQNPAARALTTF